MEIEGGIFIVAPPKVEIDDRELRTLADHIEYCGFLSASKLWQATNISTPSTQQLLESYENTSVNVAQSTSKKSRNYGGGRPWGVQQSWEGRTRSKPFGNKTADNLYLRSRDMLLTKMDNGKCYTKNCF